MNEFIYLDASATYQKPQSVIDAQVDFLENHYANAGRGVCAVAVAVDEMVGRVRRHVADFMNTHPDNIVFTSGTTASMNMIVHMLDITPDTMVAVSDLDHHSARLPFVMSGGRVCMCPLDNNLNYDLDKVPYADILILSAMSNVIGVAQKIPEIVRIARSKNPNVIVVVDCAQYVVHEKIDADAWGADFICWSGHKIGADTGLGVMYIRNPDLYMPVNFGGGMVNRVIGDVVDLVSGPEKFEAGTLPLTQISGLGVAIDALVNNRPNMDLIRYMYGELAHIPGVRLLSKNESAILTFVVEGMHPLDLGMLIGANGVCVRAGNMCATWIHERLGIAGSVRASVGGYNTMQDVVRFVEIIRDIVK